VGCGPFVVPAPFGGSEASLLSSSGRKATSSIRPSPTVGGVRHDRPDGRVGPPSWTPGGDVGRTAAWVVVALCAVLGLSACSAVPPAASRDTFAPVAGLPPVRALGGDGLVLAVDGSVWAWGANEAAQVGDADVEDCGTTMNRSPCQPEPTRIAVPGPAVAVSKGQQHGLALDTAGAVWTWGADYRPTSAEPGERCAQTSAPRCQEVPIRIEGLPPIAAVAAGPRTDLALDTTGRVWVRGGVIGGPDRCTGGTGRFPGYFDCTARPVPVGGLPPVAAVAIGPAGRLLALDTAGSVWWWGSGYPGPYPFGGPAFAAPRTVPIPVPATGIGSNGSALVATGRDGSAWMWGELSVVDRPRCTAPDACANTPVAGLPAGTVTDLVPGGSTRVRTVAGSELSYGPFPSATSEPPPSGVTPVPAGAPSDRGWLVETPVPDEVAIVDDPGGALGRYSGALALTADGVVLARGRGDDGRLGP
jgi:hypothetical protein